jgi:signal peptidase I
MTEIAQTPVEVPPGAVQASAEPTSDNPLVRAVGRIPLALRAKLLIGFAVVGALLALVAVLGLVALGQSNSRGTELRRLQRQAVLEQSLLTDTNRLVHELQQDPPQIQDAPALWDQPQALRWYYGGKESEIGADFGHLCQDAGAGACHGLGPPLQPSLHSIAPRLFESFAPAVVTLFGNIGGAQFNGTSHGREAWVQPLLVRADQWTASFLPELTGLARTTQARADALVAADHSSFSSSRNLLIGAGAGSLLLAVALGLLLASSVVAPLRRTESRLDEIAAGDFADRLEVANRDELGSLAAKVNRTSDQLQRLYQELETASRHKSDFLATMSHELRTPLNAIIGFAEVLREEISGELNEDQLADVEEVLTASEHLLLLVNDVLDLAKIEAGSMELELSEVAIPEVLHGAVSMHSERAARGGVELTLRTEPEEITIAADRRRLRQIVFNLVSNAVKFTPRDGWIDVSARLDDGQVEIAVADTGPGIAPEELETIFEEFKQGTDGMRSEGTGLGLPLSRRLVELHGGRLWVESEPGQGSTFRFTVPAVATGGHGLIVPPKTASGERTLAQAGLLAPEASASLPAARRRPRRRPILLLSLGLLLASGIALATVQLVGGGSGKSSATSGSVPVETATAPTRTVTYVEPVSTMEPTIRCGQGTSDLGTRNLGCTGAANDHVAVEEPAPPIRRLDIIIFHRPREADGRCGAGQPFIQRVIGLPGDVVREDDHGFIWIKFPGGAKFVKLNERYVTASSRLADSAHFGQHWHVPNGDYFTMGDNRSQQLDPAVGGPGSCDSRTFDNGPVLSRAIIGKVVRITRPSSG